MASSSVFLCFWTYSMISSGFKAERGTNSNRSPLAMGIITFSLACRDYTSSLAIILISSLVSSFCPFLLSFYWTLLSFTNLNSDGGSGLALWWELSYLLKVRKLFSLGVFLVFDCLERSWDYSYSMYSTCGTRKTYADSGSLVNYMTGGLY